MITKGMLDVARSKKPSERRKMTLVATVLVSNAEHFTVVDATANHPEARLRAWAAAGEAMQESLLEQHEKLCVVDLEVRADYQSVAEAIEENSGFSVLK